MSTFDPTEFLNSTITEATDTTFTPVPVGEYLAIAEKVDVRQWQGKADPSKSGLALDIVWDIQDENAKTICGRDKITCKQGIMLDLSDSGGLDMSKGKNIGLGKLRDALDLNTAGQPFSFGMITGRMAKVVVSHRIADQDIFAEIKKVVAP